MRCLQANLSYLAASAERTHKPAQAVPPGPALMSPPAPAPALVALYARLLPLFPGWKGILVKPAAAAAAGPRGAQGGAQASLA